MKTIAVTTFSNSGYEEYAHRLISSFAEFWPSDVDLYAFYDDVPVDGWKTISSNIHYVKFDDAELTAFKERNKNNPKQSGNGTNADFMKDGIRFSHKVFAYAKASLAIECDIAIWLDGDTITHTEVAHSDIAHWISGKMAATLLRPWSYTETGFHAFDMRHPNARNFMEEWLDQYRNDTVWNLSDHTDCHTYDATMSNYPAEDWNDLSPSFKHSHPFVNGILGRHMDHCKGPRKQIGKSRATDLAVKRTEKYWNK